MRLREAGGPKSQGFDTWVMLERGGRRATAPFGALVYEPSNNIWVHPNDTIYLYREPQTFIAFGAFGGSVGARARERRKGSSISMRGVFRLLKRLPRLVV